MKIKIYLIVTFAISWGIELALLLTGNLGGGIFAAMQPLVMFAPALAVLVTKYVVKEPIGMNLWFKPQGRQTVRYILLGWVGPLVLVAFGSLMFYLVYPDQFDADMTAQVEYLREEDAKSQKEAADAGEPKETAVVSGLRVIAAANGIELPADVSGLAEYTDAEIRKTLLFQIVLNVIMAPLYNMLFCVGEEFGWRGYFLHMLCEKHPHWRAVLINGLVWGVWYLPLVISLGLFYGKSYPGYPVVGIACAMVYYVVLGSIYSALTLRTCTCIPAMLANACVATIGGVGTLFLKDRDTVGVFLNPMPSSILGGMGFLITSAFIFYLLAHDKLKPAETNDVVQSARLTGNTLRKHLENEHLHKK